MSTVTFSSPLSSAAFTSFDLTLANSQSLEQLRDESEMRFALSFAGSGSRAAHAKLKSLETRVLLNGAPSMTLDGYLVAAAIGQGEMVKLAADVYQLGASDNKESLAIIGIITNVVWSAGQGPLGQRIDLVLHRCHKLHVRSSGTVTTSTDPAAEEAVPS